MATSARLAVLAAMLLLGLHLATAQVYYNDDYDRVLPKCEERSCLSCICYGGGYDDCEASGCAWCGGKCVDAVEARNETDGESRRHSSVYYWPPPPTCDEPGDIWPQEWSRYTNARAVEATCPNLRPNGNAVGWFVGCTVIGLLAIATFVYFWRRHKTLAGARAVRMRRTTASVIAQGRAFVERECDPSDAGETVLWVGCAAWTPPSDAALAIQAGRWCTPGFMAWMLLFVLPVYLVAPLVWAGVGVPALPEGGYYVSITVPFGVGSFILLFWGYLYWRGRFEAKPPSHVFGITSRKLVIIGIKQSHASWALAPGDRLPGPARRVGLGGGDGLDGYRNLAGDGGVAAVGPEGVVAAMPTAGRSGSPDGGADSPRTAEPLTRVSVKTVAMHETIDPQVDQPSRTITFRSWSMPGGEPREFNGLYDPENAIFEVTALLRRARNAELAAPSGGAGAGGAYTSDGEGGARGIPVAAAARPFAVPLDAAPVGGKGVAGFCGACGTAAVDPADRFCRTCGVALHAGSSGGGDRGDVGDEVPVAAEAPPTVGTSTPVAAGYAVGSNTEPPR